MALVRLEGVSYRYAGAPAPSLSGITTRITAGEFVILAGASGSGKSTLCRLLNGLIPHVYGGILEGNVYVNGLDTHTHTVADLFTHVGMVFQNPEAQLFNSSVEREIIFGLESLGLPRNEIRARLEWVLEQTHLTSLRSRAPLELSGGEQQAVVIAAMLALRPPLLVLDEPFATLDAAAIERICALLREAHAHGTTIIIAEHRLQPILPDATRIIVMAQGRIICDGPPRQILREGGSTWRLNTPYVIELARRAGWPEIPLSVAEAIALAGKYGAIPPLTYPYPQEARSLATPTAIEMRAVHYRRGERAILRDLSFQVKQGESVAIIGHNGAGKTSLLKLLNGLAVPSQGQALIMQYDTRRTPIARLARIVGITFQNPNAQLFKTRVRDEIEVAPRILHRLDQTWLDQLYEWFEITTLLERSPFTLSEGEKKRVAIVATLAARPDILALDEPTTGQDFVFRETLVRVLHELRTRGVTTLIATHDLELAEQTAPRWLTLHKGMLASDAPPDRIMSDTAICQQTALSPTARWQFHHEWNTRLNPQQQIEARSTE